MSILTSLNYYNKFIVIIKFNNLLSLNSYINLLKIFIIIDNNKLLKSAYKRDNIFD